MRPEMLGTNSFRTFYPGAGRIAAFRHDAAADPLHSEDWVGSTTTRFGQAPLGLSSLADGTVLADRISKDPAEWLGPERQAADGAAVLVKLLDAGTRLPLHIHPDRDFARRHLDSPFGKSEAWLVLDAEPGAAAYLGFSRDVGGDELGDLVSRQDVPALLDACHRVPLRAGDVVFCPAGVPHAIGDGVLILEVQEPTDFSIMLEWAGYDLDPEQSFLGLDQDVALQAARGRAVEADELERLRGRTIRSLATGETGVTPLLPESATAFFRAEQVVARGEEVQLEQGFGVLVVNEGAGTLTADDADPLPVTAGQTWLLPHALGAPRLAGQVSAVRCAAAG